MFNFIYVEKEALAYKKTGEILARLPKNIKIVEINDYNDIFKRPNQNYSLQKKCRSLILAKNRGNFIYSASDNCQSFGADAFYYASLSRGCLFNCDYCYLQGMYRCGYTVAFVNTEDCFDALSKLMENSGDKKVLLALSYDSDIYACEGLFGFVRDWMTYLSAKKYDNLTVEIRTKCGTRQFLSNIKGLECKNAVFTWSLSPDFVAKKFEKGAATSDMRLSAIKTAVDMGLRVRIAIDPIILTGTAAGKNNREEYVDLAKNVAALGDKIDAVSIGFFRIPSDFLKTMRKNSPNSPLCWESYEAKSGVTTYSEDKKVLAEELAKIIADGGLCRDKIFIQE